MKRFSEQFKKQAESVRLRAAERRALRERLVAYMEYHPLPQAGTGLQAQSHIAPSEAFAFIRVNTFLFRAAVGLFAVLLLVVVPVVAERSVPGDVLYAIKVNFNEEIRSGLAVSPYAQVAWETTRLERRLAEARLLASEGRLTDEVEAEVAEAVRAHSFAAQEGIASLRETDSDEAAIAGITFDSALAVQSEVLEEVLEREGVVPETATTTQSGSSVARLATVVEEARTLLNQNQAAVMPSYEKLSVRIEFDTTRAYELFESVKAIASTEEIHDIERRLSDIERKITAAAQTHSDRPNGAENSSVETTTSVPWPETLMLRTALADVQKLISFMTDIDVRENVTVEDLVPVTLTDEERREALLGAEETLAQDLTTLQALFIETDVADYTEKIRAGLEEAAEHIAELTALRKNDELDAAEQLSVEIQALLSDIGTLLSDTNNNLPASTTATTSPETGELDTSGTVSTSTVASSSEEIETTDL